MFPNFELPDLCEDLISMLMNLYPFSKNNKDRSVPTDLYLSKKLNSLPFLNYIP